MRRKPYTERGIKRVPCAKCGAPSAQQWTVCAWPGYHGLCRKCDLDLNRLVLMFMGGSLHSVSDTFLRMQKLMIAYKKKLDALD